MKILVSTSFSTTPTWASRGQNAAPSFSSSSTLRFRESGILNPQYFHSVSAGYLVILTCSKDSFNLRELLDTSPTFTMILYALPLPADQVHLIHDYGRKHRTPVIAVHSVGFYSYFNISLPGTFPIVDTHPDEAATTDLRLLDPWAELSAFAKEMTQDIDSLENHEHGHLPLVVILLHYLDLWKQSHDGKYPTTYADKTAFRKTVSDAMRRNNPEGGEENFEEAVAAVMKHVVAPSIPSTLQQVFDYPHQDPVRSYNPARRIVSANPC